MTILFIKYKLKTFRISNLGKKTVYDAPFVGYRASESLDPENIVTLESLSTSTLLGQANHYPLARLWLAPALLSAQDPQNRPSQIALSPQEQDCRSYKAGL